MTVEDRLALIRARFASAEAVPEEESAHPGPSEDNTAHGERDDGASEADPKIEAAGFPLNDIGNGRRFVAYFGRNVIRVSRVGWHVWDGQRWRKDEEDQRGLSPGVRREAQKISEMMIDEIPHLPMSDGDRRLIAQEAEIDRRVAELSLEEEPDPADKAEVDRLSRALADARKRLRDRKSEFHRFAKSTGNKAKIDAMLAEASVALSHNVGDLDKEKNDVCVDNGILSFSVFKDEGTSATAEVRLREHDRGALMTKVMPVAFDPEATCPKFDAFLERIQPDPEMRAFLQRWFGLNLTSETGDQCLAFFHGQGANGKSVLTDLMAYMMGDYGSSAKIESLTGTARRGGSDATPDLIPLMGARMVRASEPEQGTRLQEGVIKELTGGEPLLVRALHSDFVEVHPQFKLTISGNHKPDIRGTDDGIWRRLMLIPFEVQIPKAERDRELATKLRAEAPGILNWMVAGLIDYLEQGLAVPESVKAATEGYREDSDPIGSFLLDTCEITGSDADFTRSKVLAQAFNFWNDERGEGTWAERTITTRLKDRAKAFRHPGTGRTFQPHKRSVQGFTGIRISDEFARHWREVEIDAPVSVDQSSTTSPDPLA